MSNEDIRNIIITDKLKWTPQTLLMAEFEEDLSAGNISNLDTPVTQWQINRREVNGSTLKVLKSLDVGVSEFVDYSAQANKNYVYSIFATSADDQSEPLEAEEIETNFYGYYLVDEDEGLVYKFDLNVQSGTKQYQEDVTIMENYTQYPSIAIGKRKYFTDTIQCVCGEVSIYNELLQSVDYVNILRDFILNGKQKLWKSRKGEISRVFTRNFQETILEDGIEQQPLIISFDIIQVGDV